MTRGERKSGADAGYREECYRCRRVKKHCLCGSVRPFATRARFVILMHEEEAKRQRTGTGRLAALCLENSELLVGVDFSADARVNALLSDPAYAPFVLYPGPGARDLAAAAAEVPAGKTPLVFVIDGTWRNARTLLNRSPNVKALPRLSFSRGYVSRFRIKRQPMAHCVSTIEALYYLCEEAGQAGLERLEGRHGALLELQEKVVETQLGYARGRGHRREENRRRGAPPPGGGPR